MAGTRRSWTEAELVTAIAESSTIAEVIRKLGLVPAGGNYATIRDLVAKLNLDTSHLKGKGWLKGLYKTRTARKPLSEVLTTDSHTSTYHLKNRLLKAGLLESKCYDKDCGISSWKDKPLMLHLDHINGNKRDNSPDNLRLLCPNCHSQTTTYCGRNKGKATLRPRSSNW